MITNSGLCFHVYAVALAPYFFFTASFGRFCRYRRDDRRFAPTRRRGGRRRDLRVAIGKIAPWVMEHTANGQQAEFFVVLTDQADLSQAANLRTKAEKGRFVYKHFEQKRRPHRAQFCNGCVNAG